jgi:hypothetical protein
MLSFKLLIRFTATPLLLLAFASCNDSSTLSSNDRKNPPKEDKEDEDEDADTPVEVSGAYLTCDWVGEPAEGEDTVIGCTVLRKDGKVLDKRNRTFDLTLHDSDDKRVDMVSTDAPANSNWHKLAKLPASNREKGYLKMNTSIDGATEGDFRLNTSDIGKSISLGNQAEDVEEVSQETSILTSIPTHGQWKDNFKTNFTLNMDDFCEHDGEVRSKLAMESEVMVFVADEIFKTSTTNMNITKGNFPPVTASSPICFVPFKMKGGANEIAHQNDSKTCFFLHTGTTLHVMNVKNAQEKNSDFNLENLKKFASSKPCK